MTRADKQAVWLVGLPLAAFWLGLFGLFLWCCFGGG